MKELIVESRGSDEGSAAELSQLMDRVACLEAQTTRIRTQAAQVEALRKLGSWDVDVATGTALCAARTACGPCAARPVRGVHVGAARTAEAIAGPLATG